MKILLIPAGEVRPGDSLNHTDTFYRLFYAHEAWKRGDYDYILVSGGFFLPIREQTKSAAELMADYLVRIGVSQDKIILEEKATTSLEQVTLSMQMLGELGLEKAQITVATEPMHALRFYVSLRRGYGKKDTAILATPRVVSRRSGIVAGMALVYHFVDPRGESWIHQLVRRRRITQSF